MWVVKLGGSLLGGAGLHRWLDRVQAMPGRVVVVPGGGPFADAVRAAQRRWRIDDPAAHEMALLAMEQSGRLLRALAPSLQATRLAELEAGRAARCTVWRAAADALACAGLPANWSVTSDSLALWLARRLDARGLVLVKSRAVPAGGVEADRLMRDGLVDQAFPGLLAGWGGHCLLAGPGQHDDLPALPVAGPVAWPGCVAVAARR